MASSLNIVIFIYKVQDTKQCKLPMTNLGVNKTVSITKSQCTVVQKYSSFKFQIVYPSPWTNAKHVGIKTCTLSCRAKASHQALKLLIHLASRAFKKALLLDNSC